MGAQRVDAWVRWGVGLCVGTTDRETRAGRRGARGHDGGRCSITGLAQVMRMAYVRGRAEASGLAWLSSLSRGGDEKKKLHKKQSVL